jgi:hypothetical protein
MRVMAGRLLLILATAAAGVGVGSLAGRAVGAPPVPRDRFELSTELEARVTIHQDLVTNAGRSHADFCKLTADTLTILDPVVIELSAFGGGPGKGAPFEAIERAYTRTEKLIPGLTLIATEEVMQTGIDYRWLTKVAPPDARPVLRAMAGFEIGSEGVESWGVRVTDSSICEAPERGRAALTALAKAWPAAPACLKDALRDRLNQELERMVGWDCFCGERPATEAAIRKSAKLLKGLPDVHGPDFADRWLQTVRAPDTHFNCSPS